MTVQGKVEVRKLRPGMRMQIRWVTGREGWYEVVEVVRIRDEIERLRKRIAKAPLKELGDLAGKLADAVAYVEDLGREARRVRFKTSPGNHGHRAFGSGELVLVEDKYGGRR